MVYYAVLSAKSGKSAVYHGFKPDGYLAITGCNSFNEAIEESKRQEMFYSKHNPKFRYDLEGRYI